MASSRWLAFLSWAEFVTARFRHMNAANKIRRGVQRRSKTNINGLAHIGGVIGLGRLEAALGQRAAHVSSWRGVSLECLEQRQMLSVQPVVDLNGSAAGTGYVAAWSGSGTTNVDDSANATITGGTTVDSLTVALTSPGTGDILAANTSGTSISASFASGTLTLAGTDTVADYQAVLRTVTYNNTAGGPGVAQATATVVAIDGGLNSIAATATINMPAPSLSLTAGTGSGAPNFTATWYNQGTVPIENNAVATVTALSGVPTLSSITVALATFHTGDVLSLASQGLPGSLTSSYSAGTLTLSGSDTVAHYQEALRFINYNNTAGGPGTSPITATFVANDGTHASNPVTSTININVGSGQVLGNRLFYNNSKYDVNNGAINANDDLALASDKTGYNGTGTATFANVSAFNKGITGIMVDLQSGIGTHSAINLTSGDITFKVSPTTFVTTTYNQLSTWSAAPTPTAISVRLGAGVGGSDRLEITFATGVIKDEWIQVRVLADANTGLSNDDVFYFGSRPGDASVGDTAALAKTDGNDATAALNNIVGLTTPVWNLTDYTRDGKVDGSDYNFALGISASLHYLANPANVTMSFASPAFSVVSGQLEVNYTVSEPVSQPFYITLNNGSTDIGSTTVNSGLSTLLPGVTYTQSISDFTDTGSGDFQLQVNLDPAHQVSAASASKYFTGAFEQSNGTVEYFSDPRANSRVTLTQSGSTLTSVETQDISGTVTTITHSFASATTAYLRMAGGGDIVLLDNTVQVPVSVNGNTSTALAIGHSSAGAAETVAIDPQSVVFNAAGGSPTTISYSDLYALVIVAGSYGNSLAVTQGGAGTQLPGLLDVLGGGGDDSLVVDDTAATVNRTIGIDPSAVTLGTGGGATTIDYSSMSSLEVKSGSHDDSLTVTQSNSATILPAAVTLTLSSGRTNSLTVNGGATYEADLTESTSAQTLALVTTGGTSTIGYTNVANMTFDSGSTGTNFAVSSDDTATMPITVNGGILDQLSLTNSASGSTHSISGASSIYTYYGGQSITDSGITQLKLTAPTVSLNGASLSQYFVVAADQLNLSGTLTVPSGMVTGDQFTLISDTGSISGSFSGYPGPTSSVTIGSRTYTIAYSGSLGGVVFTDANPQPMISYVSDNWILEGTGTLTLGSQVETSLYSTDPGYITATYGEPSLNAAGIYTEAFGNVTLKLSTSPPFTTPYYDVLVGDALVQDAIDATANNGLVQILAHAANYTGGAELGNGKRLEGQAAFDGSLVLDDSQSSAGPDLTTTTTSNTTSLPGGTMTMYGNLTLAANGQLTVQIGSSADKFIVYDLPSSHSTINLNGAFLDLLASGDTDAQITIIENHTSNPISGTFAGMAEGALFTSGSQTFRITYVGGTSGQDVVLINQGATGGQLFTNAMNLDGTDADFNTNIGAAILSGVTALPSDSYGGIGGASANETTDSNGITGVIFDLPKSAGVTSSDFTLKVGNTNSPGSWSAAPTPSLVTVRLAAGAGGSDRVEIAWNINSIDNEWLQVTVLANANTGLTTPEVFYFGSQISGTTITSIDPPGSPLIGNLKAPAMIPAGTTGTLLASGIVDPSHALTGVDFYYDVNQNGVLDGSDTLLAHGTAVSGTSVPGGIAALWMAHFTPSATGALDILAVAVAGSTAVSVSPMQIVQVTDAPPIFHGDDPTASPLVVPPPPPPHLIYQPTTQPPLGSVEAFTVDSPGDQTGFAPNNPSGLDIVDSGATGLDDTGGWTIPISSLDTLSGSGVAVAFSVGMETDSGNLTVPNDSGIGTHTVAVNAAGLETSLAYGSTVWGTGLDVWGTAGSMGIGIVGNPVLGLGRVSLNNRAAYFTPGQAFRVTGVDGNGNRLPVGTPFPVRIQQFAGASGFEFSNNIAPGNTATATAGLQGNAGRANLLTGSGTITPVNATQTSPSFNFGTAIVRVGDTINLGPTIARAQTLETIGGEEYSVGFAYAVYDLSIW